MRVDWTGQILVSESASKLNHIARAIDSVLSTPTGYHHTKVTVAGGEQDQIISLSITEAKILYLKVTDADDVAAQARFQLDGLDVSLVTGDIKASEIMLFDTDIVALRVSNENAFDVFVEVVAAGV
jgi:hypothetical protein